MHKVIKLPNGLPLEVFVTPDFLEKVRVHFSLSSCEEVDDDHIRRFIHGAVDGAVKKAEKSLKNSS